MNATDHRSHDAMPGYAGGGHSAASHATAFRRAIRHSRRVVFLRKAIPAGVVLATAIIVVSVFFNPLRLMYKLPSDLGTLVVDGSKITMEAPRLAGFTRDERGYEIQAKAAAQDLKKPTLVELQDIRAKVDMEDKTTVEMTAKDGQYDTKAETLTLGQRIVLSSTNGYQGLLLEAVVEIREGRIVSDKPVELRMQHGALIANRLEVTQTGAVVRFYGGVSMTILPEAFNNRDVSRAAAEDSAGAQ